MTDVRNGYGTALVNGRHGFKKTVMILWRIIGGQILIVACNLRYILFQTSRSVDAAPHEMVQRLGDGKYRIRQGSRNIVTRTREIS
jgi:hypothetical protein